ncbi:hypothetical protein HYPSUDRAFT_37415 [Hypholoma sublateritium FD-334 SS-4]|uniref:Heterokaryon incompatibility domain-containing protein n=1 Tax=Hypholoma sublateritium (strain FD-334 SS-4) TaxID=945553 RepID=A0A0D2LDF1_HYPSF|nr:hypothetical protein HYPSUDRAFT_37415 [Hypholoma sublateritium FD-334 SS-4]
MLAFDSNGTQLRLVERSDIAEQIKLRISEEEWQGMDESESLDRVKELGKYAILSHTWFRGKPGDVVFDDWNKRELNARGNSKIVKFCEVAARNHSVVYGWMDTVCIDKSSSTELDESIRSMYRWYRQSHICITYLADTSEIPDMHRDTWFTRGWTLQELLAPQDMVFYSKNWSFLTQNDGQINLTMQGLTQITLKTFPTATQSQISWATSIESDELGMCSMDPGLLPISRVFQLACRRNVTREEDRVYSLMGLLGISISVAYGEGLPSAFKRLLREIMATKNNFLDVFNHSGTHELIPISISKYENRSPLFDQTSSYRPTALHQKQYMEPILMTHLGVQVPILLISMFQKSTFEALIPFAACPRSIDALQLANGNSGKYLLLGRSSISTEFISNHKATSFVWNAGGDGIIFCGILNFWKSGAVYQTSDTWLYVSVGFGPRTGSDVTDMQPLSGPLVLSWPSEHPSGYENIREQDLSKLGMTVTTLHFK